MKRFILLGLCLGFAGLVNPSSIASLLQTGLLQNNIELSISNMVIYGADTSGRNASAALKLQSSFRLNVGFDTYGTTISKRLLRAYTDETGKTAVEDVSGPGFSNAWTIVEPLWEFDFVGGPTSVWDVLQTLKSVDRFQEGTLSFEQELGAGVDGTLCRDFTISWLYVMKVELAEDNAPAKKTGAFEVPLKANDSECTAPSTKESPYVSQSGPSQRFTVVATQSAINIAELVVNPVRNPDGSITQDGAFSLELAISIPNFGPDYTSSSYEILEITTQVTLAQKQGGETRYGTLTTAKTDAFTLSESEAGSDPTYVYAKITPDISFRLFNVCDTVNTNADETTVGAVSDIVLLDKNRNTLHYLILVADPVPLSITGQCP